MKSNQPFWRRFWLSLAAVIIGNPLYFAVQRYLPPEDSTLLFALIWA